MKRVNIYILSMLAVCLASCTEVANRRQTIRLDGKWAITKTAVGVPLGTFTSVVSVPGLVDLAVPALDTPGTLYPDGWYWHQRTFDLADTDFEKIELKIYKA
jgi:hypothetical protein